MTGARLGTHQVIVLLGRGDDRGQRWHDELLGAVLLARVVDLDLVRGDAEFRQPFQLVRRAEQQQLGVGVQEGAQQDDAGQHLLHKVVVHVAVLLDRGGEPFKPLARQG